MTPKAFQRVIVDDADGLHPGVGDRRPDELEAAPLQFLRDGIRQGRAGDPALAVAEDRRAIGEGPAESREVLAAFFELLPVSWTPR